MAIQFLSGFWFYAVFTLCAGWGLFLTWRFFPVSPMAYFLAKPVGLAVFAYLIWLLSSLGLLSYQNTPAIAGTFLAVAVMGFALALKFISRSSRPVQRSRLFKNLLWLEVISLLLYFGYLFVRAFNGAAYGTERFMDMALLNASLKAEGFPFIDPWYAGQAVNYYYYGHYLISLLTKLSGLSSFLTYNYALGLLYAVAFILPALLVYEITRSRFFGILAGFLVTTAGSLFYAGCVIKAWWQGGPICSYASSTRLYTPSYIINEIPSYSFTVGDLHAHFLALPFFLVNLILIYRLSQAEKPSKMLALALLISLTASTLINPSDAVSLILLLGLVWLYKISRLFKAQGRAGIYSVLSKLKPGFYPAPSPNAPQSASGMSGASKFVFFRRLNASRGGAWIYLAAFLGAGILVLYLPFLLNFKSPVLGFGMAFSFAQKHNFLFNGFQYPTPILALLGMWGAFFLSLGAIFYFLRKDLEELMFPALSTLAAFALLVFVEIFFVKDIYHLTNPPYFRANTVFKFGYHMWVLLSVAFCVAWAGAFRRLAESRFRKKISFGLGGLMAFFVFFSLLYPALAVRQFYLTGSAGPPTLNAAGFIAGQSADDLRVIDFISRNFNRRAVILEAVGDSYSYFGRMSVFTGQISLMGWKTHEWTWRFKGAEAARIKEKNPEASVETGYGAIAKVAEDAGAIYQEADAVQAGRLLKNYGVQYVYIGDLERASYPKLKEQKFYQLGRVVFQSGNSKLFEIN